MIALIAYKLTQMFPKISARAAVFGLWIATLILIGAAIVGFYLWAYDNGRDDERAKWEAAAEHLEDADAAADAEAIDVAHDTKESFDATNQRAADAAAQSDDPLAAGFGELRGKGKRQGD